jgi:hypothetical protein
LASSPSRFLSPLRPAVASVPKRCSPRSTGHPRHILACVDELSSSLSAAMVRDAPCQFEASRSRRIAVGRVAGAWRPRALGGDRRRWRDRGHGQGEGSAVTGARASRHPTAHRRRADEPEARWSSSISDGRAELFTNVREVAAVAPQDIALHERAGIVGTDASWMVPNAPCPWRRHGWRPRRAAPRAPRAVLTGR